MDITHQRLGVGIAIVGLVLLLTLRIWASPIALVITDRAGVSVIAFLAMPLLLLVVASGIIIALWGEELGLS